MGLFTATLSRSTSKSLHATRVPLLPKLRGYFAEFLRESYLAHLSIFYQPTCGGLRYGRLTISRAKLFLAVWNQHLQIRRSSFSPLRQNIWADFPTQTSYEPLQAYPAACMPILLRPSASGNDYQSVQEYQPDIHRLRLLRPRLRVRLTPRGRACRGKP